MSNIMKNIAAVILGLLIGGGVNMSLILASGYIIPPPQGVDNTTMEGLQLGIHLFEPKHFIFPFLAHALGTFVGALIAAFMASSRPLIMSMVIGVCFLIGGIMNIIILSGPLWFSVLDIVFAYIPMAWLAARLAKKTPQSE